MNLARPAIGKPSTTPVATSGQFLRRVDVEVALRSGTPSDVASAHPSTMALHSNGVVMLDVICESAVCAMLLSDIFTLMTV